MLQLLSTYKTSRMTTDLLTDEKQVADAFFYRLAEIRRIMGVTRKSTNENGALKEVFGMTNGNIGHKGIKQSEGTDIVFEGTGT